MRRTWKVMSPFLVFVFLCGSVARFTALRWEKWNVPESWFALAFGVAFISWAIFEVRCTVRDFRERGPSAEGWAAEAYGLAHCLTAFAAFSLEPRWAGESQRWLLVGAVVFLGSVWLRVAAVRALGRFYSHRLRVLPGHAVVSSGPYQWIRHPAYTGMAGIHFGLCLAFPHLVSWCLFFLLLVPSLVFRIRVEEAMLRALPDYRRFAVHRKRLLPGVW